MQIKRNNHSDIVFNYFFAKGEERKHYCRASSIFFEGDTLYSYGHHFPLAVKCKNGNYILNGDTYSRETNGHQALTRNIADLLQYWKSHIRSYDKLVEMTQEYNKTQKQKGNPNFLFGSSIDTVRIMEKLRSEHTYRDYDFIKREYTSLLPPMDTCPICQKIPKGHKPVHHCIIPFSSLNGPGIEPKDLTILDVTEDTHETVTRKNPKTGKMEKHEIHFLGASLVRNGHKRYLSSIDAGSNNHSFFLVELKSRRINTVEDAFRNLASKLTDKQYKDYQMGIIQRQGEFFLEPHLELSIKELKKQAKSTRVKLGGVLDVVVKTTTTKRWVREAIGRDREGKYGFGQKQIRVINQGGIPYYVLLDGDNTDMDIPKGASLFSRSINETYSNKGWVEVNATMVNHFDLSGGDGNPHTARDMIQTADGMFIRKTLRHPEHKMIRMGKIWNQVYMNTALGSWSAEGRVD